MPCLEQVLIELCLFRAQCLVSVHSQVRFCMPQMFTVARPCTLWHLGSLPRLFPVMVSQKMICIYVSPFCFKVTDGPHWLRCEIMKVQMVRAGSALYKLPHGVYLPAVTVSDEENESQVLKSSNDPEPNRASLFR